MYFSYLGSSLDAFVGLYVYSCIWKADMVPDFWVQIYEGFRGTASRIMQLVWLLQIMECYRNLPMECYKLHFPVP